MQYHAPVQTTPVLTVSDLSGAFNGGAFLPTESISAIKQTAGLSLEGVTPTLTFYSGSIATGTDWQPPP